MSKLKLDLPVKGELTEAKKKQIRRALEKWGEIAANPDQFKRVNISKLGSAEKKALAKTGYAMRGDIAYLPKEGFTNVSIAHIKVKNPETGKAEKRLVINRRYRVPIEGEKKTEVVKRQQQFLSSKATERMSDRDRLLEEYKAGKFKRGELVGLKVYDNNAMGQSFKLDFDDLFKYAELIKWQGNVDPSKMMANLHIVKYWVKDMNEAPYMKSSSQIRSEQRKRAKKRQGVGVKYKGRGPK